MCCLFSLVIFSLFLCRFLGCLCFEGETIWKILPTQTNNTESRASLHSDSSSICPKWQFDCRNTHTFSLSRSLSLLFILLVFCVWFSGFGRSAFGRVNKLTSITIDLWIVSQLESQTCLQSNSNPFNFSISILFALPWLEFFPLPHPVFGFFDANFCIPK